MAITLNSKTYNFVGFDKNGVSTYQETSAGVPSGFSYLTCRVTLSTSGDSVVRWRLSMPVVAATDTEFVPAGTILRTYRFDDGKLTIPASGTAAERTDFAARVTALAAVSQFTTSITGLTQPSS